MTKESRNQIVSKMMDNVFKTAKERPGADYLPLSKDLDILFSSNSWGFREMVLVCVIAKQLDGSFDPYKDLYFCNPRALYENDIKKVLEKYKIPHRKSGPLNVAKAAQGLDEEWASQRRPKEAADSVVNCIKALAQMTAEQRSEFSVALFCRFLKEADKVSEYNVIYDSNADPVNLYRALKKMIDEAMDGGNTPQFIVGALIRCYLRSLNSNVIVTGCEDRASVTSTTSKKPGDIQEESPEGLVLKVYEVTMKSFDDARMQDSYDTLSIYAEKFQNIKEIIVICREKDCPTQYRINVEGTKCLGTTVFHGINYVYYDIYDWIFNQVLRLDDEARRCFFKLFGKYVSDFNTAMDVKKKWKECFEQYLDSQSEEISSIMGTNHIDNVN